MATATVNYAYSASCDTTYNIGWATVRGQATSEDTTPNECNAEASALSDPRYMIKRGFLSFNTNGALPAGYTVSAVSLSITWGAGFGNQGYYVVPNNMASPTSIAAGDYDSLTGTALSAKFSGTGVLSIPLTGLTIVNDGYTKIGIIHYYDYENTTPPTGTHGFSGPPTTASLVITYTTAPVVTTGDATEIKPTTATLGGNVTSAGGGTVSTRGVCWSTSANPTTSSSKAAAAGTTGAFTVSATGLKSGVLYHYRAYVTTENSTTYGADATFRTIFGGNFIPFI